MNCEHCFHEPTFKAREAQQAPYRGLWNALCAWEQVKYQEGNPIYPGELRAVLHRLWDEQPEAAAAFAQNTTRYDRPLGEQV